MTVIYILIAFALCFAGFFLGAFIWAMKTGQYDDADTPAQRILFDDTLASPANGTRNSASANNRMPYAESRMPQTNTFNNKQE